MENDSLAEVPKPNIAYLSAGAWSGPYMEKLPELPVSHPNHGLGYTYMRTAISQETNERLFLYIGPEIVAAASFKEMMFSSVFPHSDLPEWGLDKSVMLVQYIGSIRKGMGTRLLQTLESLAFRRGLPLGAQVIPKAEGFYIKNNYIAHLEGHMFYVKKTIDMEPDLDSIKWIPDGYIHHKGNSAQP
jgi:hypothetical protein